MRPPPRLVQFTNENNFQIEARYHTVKRYFATVGEVAKKICRSRINNIYFQLLLSNFQWKIFLTPLTITMAIGKNSIDLLLTSSLLQILWGSMIHDWRPPLQTCCWLDLGDSGWRMQALQRIFLHMFYFACFWRPDYCKLLQNVIYRRAASGLRRMWRRKMPSLVFGMHTLQSSQLVTSQKYKHYTWSERRTSQTDSPYFWGD